MVKARRRNSRVRERILALADQPRIRRCAAEAQLLADTRRPLARLRPLLDDLDCRSTVLELAAGHFAERAARPGPAWITELVAWVADVRLPREELHQLTASTAWAARQLRNSPVMHLDAAEVAAAGTGTPHNAAMVYLLLQGLRFDFRFRECRDVAAATLRRTPGDVYVSAHRAFGLLGESDPAARQAIVGVVADPTSDAKTLHVVLHGLWFADRLDDRVDLMLDICERIRALQPHDPIEGLRRAFALRRRGDYPAALRTLDGAVEWLAPDDPELHQDFVRERVLVQAEQELAALVTRGQFQVSSAGPVWR